MIKKLLHLNFLTKILIILFLPLVLMIGNLSDKNLILAILVSLIPCFLLIANGKIKESIINVILMILGVLSQMYLLKMNLGIINAFAMFLVQMMLKMWPGFLMAKITFKTTNMNEIISSLKKIHMPDQITIPVTVMARFFYTIKIDYKHIKNAMYMDGMTICRLFFHPINFFEYRLIPLLMILLRSADEVGISAVCRGLQVGTSRTDIVESKLMVIDYLCILSMVIILIITWRFPYA